MRSSQPWPEFIRHARPHVNWDKAGVILCLDPGETTGWALFAKGELYECGQEATGKDPSRMAALIRRTADEWADDDSFPDGLELILFEEYRVRGNKFKEHVGSEVVTIQHIGAILVVAVEYGIGTRKQSAGLAKGFATDVKLRRWGLYQVSMRHANDAIRHGCHYLLFNHAPENRAHGQHNP